MAYWESVNFLGSAAGLAAQVQFFPDKKRGRHTMSSILFFHHPFSVYRQNPLVDRGPFENQP